MVVTGLQSPSPPVIDQNIDDGKRDTVGNTECHQDGISDPSTSLSCYSMASLIDHLKNNWKVIALGQGLSFLLACAGAAQATLHLSCGLSAPNFTTALVYLGLAIIYLPILFCRRQSSISFRNLCSRRRIGERLSTHDSDAVAHHFGEEQNEASFENIPRGKTDGSEDGISHGITKKPLSWSLQWYLMQAFFDVEANAVTMLAFRYTTLTSVTLFDALAIPASMLISRFVFFRSSRRYRFLHYVGVLVCMVGVVLNVYQDYESDSEANGNKMVTKEYPHKLWGDICAITGGILFGLNDVLTEVTVGKAGDTTEYLGMVGIFGFLIAFLQSLLFERKEIQKFFPGSGDFDSGDSTDAMCSANSGFLLLSAFVGVTLCSYVGGTHFLVISEAAFLNLSFLTGDLWSVLFSVVAERIVPRPLFFVALTTVLSGVIIYEMAPSPALEKSQNPKSSVVSNGKEREESDQNQGYEEGVDGIMVVKGGYNSIGSKDRRNGEAHADSVELKPITIT